MGKDPKPLAQQVIPKVKAVAPKAMPPPRKINCFVMDKPPKAGLMLVSTEKVQDGCYVIAWQAPVTTLLVSEGPPWYDLAGKMFKAQALFSGVFAFCLLVVLVLNSRGR